MRFSRLIRNVLDGKNILFLAVMLVSSILFFAARNISVSQIWKGYRVLYVPSSASEETVLSVLSESGCRDVISLSSQRLPIASKFLGSVMDSSSYLKDRLGYFRDADGDYNLFYIPDSFEKESETAVTRLSKDFHLGAGLDAKESYPFLIPVVVLGLYIFLLVVSLKKLYFALPALFPLMLSFSRPFYPVVCGCCFLMFAIFLSNRIWGRNGAVACVLKNFYVDFLVLLAMMLFMAQSLQCFALALLSLLASSCAILFLRELRVIKDKNSSFTYRLIFTARQIPIMYPRTAGCMLCLPLPLFAFLLMCIFSAKFSSSVSASGIKMPSPVQQPASGISQSDPALGGAVLPNEEDFFKWAWGVISYPYLSLNGFSGSSGSSAVQEGDRIVLPRYEETDKGIRRKDESLLVYNNSFRRDMEKTLASLDYPAVEKLLKEQDRNVLVMYSALTPAGGRKGDLFNLLAIIISLCAPLLLCAVFYSINRSRS
ncbi:MAG: hypothetical protein IJU95_01295 [Treponema sp.]|nr:hypothetical protein [Treponema sp.]